VRSFEFLEADITKELGYLLPEQPASSVVARCMEQFFTVEFSGDSF